MLELSRSSLLKPERIVNKGGDRNVSSKNIPEKSRLFLKDIVHTLVKSFLRIERILGINFCRFHRRSKLSGDGCSRFMC